MPLFQKSIIALTVLFALNACIHKPQGVTMNHSNPQEPPSIANKFNFNNPVLNAEQALQGVLRLLEGLHDVDELTVTRVKDATGIGLLLHPKNTFHFSNQLTEEWWYEMSLSNNSLKPSFRFSFNVSFNEKPEFVEKRPDLTGICKLGLDQFHAALIKMGYQHVSDYGHSSPARQYKRSDVRVDIDYAGESEERPTHGCIKSIRIVD